MTNTNQSSTRTRTEIVIQILEAVDDYGKNGDGRTTKTTLMYRVFLNSNELNDYLIALTARNLLYYDPAMRTYNITKKGLLFLDLWYNMSKMADQSRHKQQQRTINVDSGG